MNIDSKRIFLGFSLNELQSAAIVLIQKQLPESLRPVPKANLHMTLAFLGAATDLQIQHLIDKVDALHKPQFSVTLNSLVHWQKPKILCLNGDADSHLRQFAMAAQSIAAELSLHCSEHSYNPHVTLCRKAKTNLTDIAYSPMTIRPTQLHLFESYPGANGVEYPTLHSWNLA